MQSTLPFSLRFSLSSVSADAKLRISLPRSRHNSALHKDPSLIGDHILPNPSPALDANAANRQPPSGFSLFGCERTLTNALSRTHTHTACASAYAYAQKPCYRDCPSATEPSESLASRTASYPLTLDSRLLPLPRTRPFADARSFPQPGATPAPGCVQKVRGERVRGRRRRCCCRCYCV